MTWKCNLCPRKCNVDRKKKLGVCGASTTLKIARAALHFWEEPCLSGEKGSGTIFFSFCPLQCIFCQNHQLSHDHLGQEITISQFADICLDLQKQGANNINLVTPTHYVPWIVEGITLAKKRGLHLPIVYNTSSYESVETIQMLNGIVDIYLPDLKYFDDQYGILYSHAPNYFSYATVAIQEMVKQVGEPIFNEQGILQRGVIVRHLCIPGLKDDSKKVLNYLYTTYHNQIYISIMNQYTPVRTFKRFSNLNRPLSENDYEEIIDYALDIGITQAYQQEGKTQLESFIPEFKNKVIE